MAAALAIAALLPIAACARVEVHGGDDGVAVRHLPGVAAISVADAEGPMRVRASGLGLGRTPLGTSLGAWRTDLVVMPAAGCSLMVVADDPATLRPVLDALTAAGIRDVCTSAPPAETAAANPPPAAAAAATPPPAAAAAATPDD